MEQRFVGCDISVFSVSSERGGWAPRESCGTPQSSSGHSEAGCKVHPQSPRGDGVTIWENEVGKAPATEQLSAVGFIFPASSSAPLGLLL